MTPETITIDGRMGTIVYLDALWHPVSPQDATMARVLFADGGTAFYTSGPATAPRGDSAVAKFDEAKHPREAAGTAEGGQFTSSAQGGVASDPVLRAQAKLAIETMEQLLPHALQGADFKTTTVAHRWADVHPETQEKAKEAFLDREGLGDNEGDKERLILRLARWEQLSDENKFYRMVEDYDIWAKPREFAAEEYVPKQWVTGVAEGELSDENYERTGLIARQLAIIRTDQLRKERGLDKPGALPKFTIEDESQGELHHGDRFLIKDEHGHVVGGSNSLRQAEESAEQWALQVSQQAAKITSQDLITHTWTAWKHKSSEGFGAALQLAAARELNGHHRMTPEEVTEAEKAAQSYGGIANLQAYVRAQWEVTQFVMHKAGEPSVDVYRGLMLPGEAVRQTPHTIVDKMGGELAPPTDIEHVKNWEGNNYVHFKFNGEQFVVEKKRTQANSILDLENWEDVKPDVQDKVLTAWIEDTKTVDIPSQPDATPEHKKEMATALFHRMTAGAKIDLMNQYVWGGQISAVTGPVRAFESDASAIQRRLDKYLYEDKSKSGMLFSKLPNITLQRAGAQSTTGTREVANDWGGVGDIPPNAIRVVLRIKAPATSVLSLPVFGENKQNEHESVLVGTKDHWLWDAWRDKAPHFTSQPLTTKKSEPLVIDLQAEDRGRPHWLSNLPSVVDLKRETATATSVWDETKHPRNEDGEFTRVAMTSQRGEGDPGHQSNKEVFEHMRVFSEALHAIPGVSRVSVKPGVGGWEGGSESMWQIYYRGNGEATQLIARTAKQFNQDAVLMLKKCEGQDCQPAVELSFTKGLSATAREHVQQLLVGHGIGGWTWMKREGRTLLRMVCVPQWGGDTKTHQQATVAVSKRLKEDGFDNHRQVRKVAVSVMEREGAHSYDSILAGKD